LRKGGGSEKDAEKTKNIDGSSKGVKLFKSRGSGTGHDLLICPVAILGVQSRSQTI
jgi:hypothetical protein